MLTELSPSSRFIWKIDKVSKLGFTGLTSAPFMVGGFVWQAKVYLVPADATRLRGCTGEHKDLSVYLFPADATKLRSYEVDFSVVITSQTHRNNTLRFETKHTFTEASGFGWKKPSIFRYSELHDSSKGYIKNDSCVIKLEISCNCSVSTTQIKPKDGESSVDLREHPGQPFEEGRHNIKGDFCEGEEFIDIGGFSVSRTQASLYELIWAKYGHIPSTKVIPISSYTSLVMVVKDLMSSVIDMHQCRLVELSTEMIDVWDDKIKMAEKLEFNISWLRERLESVKKSVPGMQKFKTGLLEHGQPLRAAKSNMKAISDMLKKAEAQLDAAKDYVRQNASGLLSESDIEMYLEMGENLLFDGMF